MHEQFSDATKFAEYLIRNGWVSTGNENNIVAACAAFAMFERKKGIELAQSAMNKACEKAR